MLQHLKSRLTAFIERRWYGHAGALRVLSPLEKLFIALAGRRRERQLQQAYHSHLPVIIVGNISVGGTGKTPLLIALSQYLAGKGYRPAIISRAYKSQAQRKAQPVMVTAEHSYREVGDEPLEIYLRTALPVVVGSDRVTLVQYVESQTSCDVVLADDGLQNYRLGRDIEIVVIDGLRGWGNGRCLPVGPLRELPSRATQADFCLVNGGGKELSVPGKKVFRAVVKVAGLRNLLTKQTLPLSQVSELGPLVAVAGMGNPQKFFNTLSEYAVEFERRTFPDHGDIRPADFAAYTGKHIIMSGKDAVKCREFAQENYWQLEVDLQPEQPFLQGLLSELQNTGKG